MAETVIGGAFLLVGQDAVGLGNLLEARHRFFRAAVSVRMVRHRQLAIGGFQAGGVDGPLDLQDFVIVTRRHQAFVLSPLPFRDRLRGSRNGLTGLTWASGPMMQVPKKGPARRSTGGAAS